MSEDSESKQNYYGEAGKNLFLPFYRPVAMPAPYDGPLVIPGAQNEACAGRVVFGGVVGAVGGVGLGFFFSTLMSDWNAPPPVVKGRQVPPSPMREQLRSLYKAAGPKMGGWAKSFGILSALIGGVECVVEKYRGKHDVWNPAISGCVVGGTMAAKSGPAAACLGCAGFAGFSLVADKFMQH